MRVCGSRVHVWVHCTHIAVGQPHVASSSRDLIAKSEKSCGPSLQCCDGIQSCRIACSGLFRRRAYMSCSARAFGCASDLPGTGPGPESAAWSHSLNSGLRCSNVVCVCRGREGSLRKVADRLCRVRAVCDSTGLVGGVGQTCLCSCSKKMGAGVSVERSATILFAVVISQRTGVVGSASHPEAVCCRLDQVRGPAGRT